MWRIGVLLLCATAVSAITKGYVPDETDVPWVVNIMFSNPKETHHCGGALMSTRWILSAASCCRKNEPTAYALLGAVDMTNIRQKLPITEVITHEKFGSISWKNDIGLCKLGRPATLNEYVNVIRLPSWTQAKKQTFKNWDCTVSGHGRDGETSLVPVPYMKAVDVHVISNFACWWSYPAYLGDTNICTQGKGVTCDGDEGSPLWIIEQDGEATCIGIASYEFDLFGCTSIYPAVFARVTEFLKWIKEKVGNDIPIRD